ncbi:divergent protein kinase domain 2A [Plutella xylostella]|uniref:divergent protein kinase domain 2A n=1 Tax=Plutella xylostella TaxID=51655 RepID=UPI00203224D7|nr:divergent protein kinase domain 2A [Plutella xylostella]
MSQSPFRRFLVRLRRRYSRPTLFIAAIVILAMYICFLLFFGDGDAVSLWRLAELNTCPACYGTSVCPELYSNLIQLDPKNRKWFNAKNVFYGSTRFNSSFVLKKLAHHSEFKEFDRALCGQFNLQSPCTSKLLNVGVEEKILKSVEYNVESPPSEPRKGLIMCPNADSIFNFIAPVFSMNGNHQAELMNIYTMLSLNPEPIILKVLRKSKGWLVPGYAGVCGRLEVVTYEGKPLSDMIHVQWYRKLYYSLQILQAGIDFTLKHKRYRFYLMDWSLDNIVVDHRDIITFVDLEDVIVLDKNVSPKVGKLDWTKRHSHEDTPGFSFSIQNICKYHFSDHNLWAACYIIAGDDNPLLTPIPKRVMQSTPKLQKLLNNCLHQNDRLHSAISLTRLMYDLLKTEKVGGYGVNSTTTLRNW